jgi:CRISPR system Cascade subunit CasE
MFLSQLLVNSGSHPDKPRPGLDWIKQTYRVHQRLWMAFPDEHRLKEDPFFLGTWSSDALAKPQRKEGGFLFRIEPDPPLRVLVQSAVQPNWEYAFRNASHLLASPPQVREFEPAFEAGASYRFRLVMQMVRRRTVPTGKREDGQKARSEHPIRCLLPPDADGRRRPDPEFTAWRDRLVSVAEGSGFAVGDYPAKLRVQPATNLYMKSEGRDAPTRFSAAMFEGILRCTDASLLHNAVVNGVGRGKAFGMGLLSLAVMR